MKKIRVTLIVFSCIYFLAACSGTKEKKVLVMASGKVQVNDNLITLDPGTTHTETEVEVPDATLKVTTPSGSSEFSVPEEGLYILNIKNDTLVGSYQRIGTDNSQQVISQENLKYRIDSLRQLMAGSNANTANKNYCIPPMQIAKVSGNTGSQIIGPYKKVPGSFEGGKEHEIYKFYTNKEMHEIIGKLSKMVDSVKSE